MFLRQITDSVLAQNAYVIGCQRTGEAVVVDPERDVDRYLKIAEENGLRLSAVADTHIHADYLSGARELVVRHGAHGYFSAEGGEDWQFEWALGRSGVTLLKDGDGFWVGNIEIRALLTPGHTPEHLSFLVIDHGGGADEPMGLLSGDFLFVGDVGRPDLLESAAGHVGAREPAARKLYESLRETVDLPGFVQVLPAHGAGSACGKALGSVPSSVLDYERRYNGALRQALEGEEQKFVDEILEGQPEPPLYFARMKRDNRRGPVLLEGGELPVPRRIEGRQVEEWVGVSGRAVLDLRSDRVAFMESHVAGSLFAPMSGGKHSVAAGSYLDENDEILLLVESEEQVAAVTRDLVRIGLDRVVAWMPVEDALAQDSTRSSIPRISARDLAREIVEEGTQVVDVRGSSEFSKDHVAGAYSMPYTRLAEQIVPLPESRHLLVHCASGLRAAMASAFLARQGWSVTHVDGDFDEIPETLRTEASTVEVS
ncbi:hydroxyacylglutathione hydrolase [Haloferula luteola]|uniref:Hydroxyacylglutathione hydrolase n=1 Tax=Haloferula luteola TaxID=595692 RepID=A0A840V6I2_9BACT|nr:MBL fold metallo-hydrolase [Haloferula luteola]MBB5353635.1 hydroxyacylglutathione hydrolase [Haloferula luteola]